MEGSELRLNLLYDEGRQPTFQVSADRLGDKRWVLGSAFVAFGFWGLCVAGPYPLCQYPKSRSSGAAADASGRDSALVGDRYPGQGFAKPLGMGNPSFAGDWIGGHGVGPCFWYHGGHGGWLLSLLG